MADRDNSKQFFSAVLGVIDNGVFYANSLKPSLPSRICFTRAVFLSPGILFPGILFPGILFPGILFPG